MIDGKRAARSGSIQSAAHHDERARHGGRDKGKGEGRREGRSRSGKKDEAKTFGVS